MADQLLYPQGLNRIPGIGSTKSMMKFGFSDGYPALVKSIHFDSPIWIIANYDFRRGKWIDRDGDSIDMIDWYSQRKVSTVPTKKPIPRTYNKWTTTQIKHLKDNYQKFTNKELAEQLGRTLDSVIVKARQLELYKGKEYHQRKEKDYV